MLKDFTREVLRNFRGADVGDEEQWVLDFGAEYFTSLRDLGPDATRGARAGAGARGGGAADADNPLADPEMLQRKITAIFLAADRDGNGVLDRREFKAVRGTVGGGERWGQRGATGWARAASTAHGLVRAGGCDGRPRADGRAKRGCGHAQVVQAFAQELNLPLEDVRLLLTEADQDADGMVNYNEFVRGGEARWGGREGSVGQGRAALVVGRHRNNILRCSPCAGASCGGFD